jgi:hypothetical protein
MHLVGIDLSTAGCVTCESSQSGIFISEQQLEKVAALFLEILRHYDQFIRPGYRLGVPTQVAARLMQPCVDHKLGGFRTS